MDKRHRFLPIHKITEGMVLADDLMDKLGHVLLPAGAAITDATLKSLGRHDILQLCILVDEVPGEEQDQLIELQNKADRIDILFRKNPCDSPTTMLLSYVQKYRSGKAS